MKKFHFCMLMLIRKINRINFFVFFVISPLLYLLHSYFSYRIISLNSDYSAFFNDYPKGLLFVTAVIIAPAFETFIFQFIIIEAMYLFINKIRWSLSISILLSSILFGLNHLYSLEYCISAIISGIFFGLIYYSTKFRICKCDSIVKSILPFTVVYLIHFINNLLAFIE